MAEDITYVGLDTHLRKISVALLPPGGEVLEWQVPNEPASLGRLKRKLAGYRPIRICYEAGPLGYVLKRQLDAADLPCAVIAPSLTPRRPGERVKTDRRDARKLAELLRGKMLVEVYPPNEEQESVRDLWRSREDAHQDLMRARHRLGKFLLRRGLVFRGGGAWSRGHHAWLGSLVFERDTDRSVFEDYLLAVEQVMARRESIDRRIEEACALPVYRKQVGALRCFRGVATVTGLAVASELFDARRFPTPAHLAGYLGLTPSEYSSSDHRYQGGITKTGNTHLRRLLIEAAWHYRHHASVGAQLRKRRDGQPPEIIALADRAQQRLCRRYRRMMMRGKHQHTIVVATARELACYLWTALQLVQAQET
jgi:transposase